MTDDLNDDPEFRRWAKTVREDLVPKLDSSAYVMSLVPEGPPDVKFAVELGMAIMLDKPIIAVVVPGVKVPERLIRVADQVIEANIRTDAGRRALAVTLKAILQEYGQ